LSTDSVIGITDVSAASGGTFLVRGIDSINFKGLQWDTTNQFHNPWSIHLPGGYDNFFGYMTGLFSNTTYYVRAYAGVDSQHIYYGDTLQFKTLYVPGNYLVSTLAGSGNPGANNGDTAQATFNGPQGATVDPAGNIYIAEASNKDIRKITPAGVV